MSARLQTIGWLVCVVYATIPAYWLLIHPFADHWRARNRSPFRVLLPLWIAMWVIACLATAPWRRTVFYATAWAWVPALLLFAVGFFVYARGGKNFSGRQLGGLPELRSSPEAHRLVTSGIRSRVRHPIYLGHLCEMLAWSLGTGLAVCFALTAFAALTGALMIWQEDEELERRFGQQFLEYRKKVPAVFPRIEP